MRAHFGGYFLGQIGTFTYLVGTMGRASQFNIAEWPQFSIYNLVVANFWPLYWVGYLFDAAKLDATYWRVYQVAQARAVDMLQLYSLIAGPPPPA